ncbi:MAG: hypothetical protein JNK49_20705 [Planctomycetes bacterium]|nr:hypothetical protein [Planctomycetota bacterium]
MTPAALEPETAAANALPPLGVPRPQTPLQWAVRWHAVLLVACLLGSVPVLHTVWHGLLGRREALIPTRSQTPWPEPDWADLQSGAWMGRVERHLQQASPVAFWLRAPWNELLLACGVANSPSVQVGRDGWLFLRADQGSPQSFAQRRAARAQTFAAVRAECAAAGVELFVSLVPNKTRVHPEFLKSALPADATYATVLAELQAVGLPVVDVAAAMAAAKAAEPTRPLYFRGDTHWLPFGALVAGQAVAAAVEARCGASLGPRGAVQLGPRTTFQALGDLVAMLGLATADLPWVDGRRITVGLSLTAHSFGELREYYSVASADPALATRLDGTAADAPVWLVGTSFSRENGMPALALALGRPVRLFGENGAASIAPMAKALAALREPGAKRPGALVWEIVERGFFEPEWAEPQFSSH